MYLCFVYWSLFLAISFLVRGPISWPLASQNALCRLSLSLRLSISVSLCLSVSLSLSSPAFLPPSSALSPSCGEPSRDRTSVTGLASRAVQPLRVASHTWRHVPLSFLLRPDLLFSPPLLPLCCHRVSFILHSAPPSKTRALVGMAALASEGSASGKGNANGNRLAPGAPVAASPSSPASAVLPTRIPARSPSLWRRFSQRSKGSSYSLASVDLESDACEAVLSQPSTDTGDAVRLVSYTASPEKLPLVPPTVPDTNADANAETNIDMNLGEDDNELGDSAWASSPNIEGDVITPLASMGATNSGEATPRAQPAGSVGLPPSAQAATPQSQGNGVSPDANAQPEEATNEGGQGSVGDVYTPLPNSQLCDPPSQSASTPNSPDSHGQTPQPTDTLSVSSASVTPLADHPRRPAGSKVMAPHAQLGHVLPAVDVQEVAEEGDPEADRLTETGEMTEGYKIIDADAPPPPAASGPSPLHRALEDEPHVLVRVTTFFTDDRVESTTCREVVPFHERAKFAANSTKSNATAPGSVQTQRQTTFHSDHSIESESSPSPNVLSPSVSAPAAIPGQPQTQSARKGRGVSAQDDGEDWQARALKAESRLRDALATLAAWEAALPTFVINPNSQRASVAEGLGGWASASADAAVGSGAGLAAVGVSSSDPFDEGPSQARSGKRVATSLHVARPPSESLYDRNVPDYRDLMLRASITVKEQLVKLRLQLNEAEMAREEDLSRAEELEALLKASRAEATRLRRQLAIVRQSQISIGSVDTPALLGNGNGEGGEGGVFGPAPIRMLPHTPQRRGLRLDHVGMDGDAAADSLLETTTASAGLSSTAPAAVTAPKEPESESTVFVPPRRGGARTRRRSSRSVIEMDENGDPISVEHESYASAMASRFLRLHAESQRRGEKSGSAPNLGVGTGPGGDSAVDCEFPSPLHRQASMV